MNWIELRDFRNELNELRSFLLSAISAPDAGLFGGVSLLRDHGGFAEALETRGALEGKIVGLRRGIRYSAPELQEQLDSFLRRSQLVRAGAEIAVEVRIASLRRRNTFAYALARSLLIFTQMIGTSAREIHIGNTGASVKSMLVELEYLIPLVEEAEKFSANRSFGDDDSFRPSNVDPEQVKGLIDEALVNISSDNSIDESLKEQLVEYLRSANSELAERTPEWRKIVGALIITSTILSGIAAAPDAYRNINSALEYILGTSIDNVIQNRKRSGQFFPPLIET